MPASRTSTSPYPDYDIHKVIQAVRNPTPDLVNVFAHRGVRLLGGTTENSLTAIAAAARAGYEGIEIDLRLTKDKRVVVFHDAGLGRLTDVKLPKGETYYNPFTGKGYSPLVKETKWVGEMEHLHLRDDSGGVTDERPVLLKELLDFMRIEGITMLVHLDIKDPDLLPYAYDIISKAVNPAGVAAMEWCLWKPPAHLFPTPEVWERQDWVQRALKSGRGMAFVLLHEKEDEKTLDSIKAWAKCDYLLTFELHVPLIGGQLQSTLDWVLSQGHGVGSWYIGGDVPRQYYDEDTDGGLFWDDSNFRKDILASGPGVRAMLQEWIGLISAGGIIGQPPNNKDTRVDLDALVNKQRFTYIVADPFYDLNAELTAMGKRNVTRMLATRLDE